MRRILLNLSAWIDRGSEALGWLTCGLTLIMVAIGAYNAITRYLGQFIGTNLSSNRYIEVQWYLFSLIFLFGAPYVLKRAAHVRVDILYSRLSQKWKAWIDLVGTLILLLPMCIVIIWYSYPAVVNSWKVLEQSSDPNGLPRYPLRTAIVVAIALLAIQAVSEVIKQVAILLNWIEPAPSISEEG